MAAAKAAHHLDNMTSLHDVVVDYVIHQGYASTARVLARSLPTATAAQVGHVDVDDTMDLDIDGDGEDASAGPPVLDEGVLVAIERRSAILSSLLDGAIQRAIDDLEAHFPAVLAVAKPFNTSNGHGSATAAPYAGASNSASAFPTAITGSLAPPALSPASAWSSSSLPSSSSTMTALANASSSFPPSSLSVPPTFTPWRRSTPTNAPLPVVGPDHARPVFAHSIDPAHVRLNLQTQQFIESFRHFAQNVGSSPSSRTSSFSSSGHDTGAGAAGVAAGGLAIGRAGAPGGPSSSLPLTRALTDLQALHAEAKKLGAAERAIYLQEFRDAGALFAYSEPEKSPVDGFLKQERRIALAKQVNAAILKGRHTQSQLERCVRRTSALYAIMSEREIDPQAWEDGGAPAALSTVRRGALNDGFNLHDFAAQNWN